MVADSVLLILTNIFLFAKPLLVKYRKQNNLSLIGSFGKPKNNFTVLRCTIFTIFERYSKAVFMKVLLDIKDNKVSFVMELLDSLTFCKS